MSFHESFASAYNLVTQITCLVGLGDVTEVSVVMWPSISYKEAGHENGPRANLAFDGSVTLPQ